jgi:hypothetical protein
MCTRESTADVFQENSEKEEMTRFVTSQVTLNK